MLKILLDTNVLISALIKSGKPRELIFELIRKRAQLILSRNILEEFVEVVNDPNIRKYVDEDDMIGFLRAIGSMAKIIRVKSNFKIVKQDPDDDTILRTAYDGKADYIVSGDDHLLAIKRFREIKIVTVSEMLEILKKT
jgi:putative PIN family toxin of toxin-antitoxin system